MWFLSNQTHVRSPPLISSTVMLGPSPACDFSLTVSPTLKLMIRAYPNDATIAALAGHVRRHDRARVYTLISSIAATSLRSW